MKKSLSILLLFITLFAACKKDGGTPDIPVTSIKLSETTASVVLGQTLTLTASVLPDNATDKAVTWSSSNNEVATVDSKTGVVTGVKLGVADIIATAGGVTATCEVSVDPDNNLTDGVLSLHIEAAGTLSSLAERIAEGKPFETLRLNGKINGDDLAAIPDMVSIKVLDLANVDIVSGGTYNLTANHFGKYEQAYAQEVAERYQELTALEKVILPNSLEKIEYRAFYNTKIKEVVIPDGVDSIENRAFEFCQSLESITLPKDLKYIGTSTFERCRKLTGEINIPEGVKTISSDAFKGCSSISKVVLPEGLEQLGTDENGVFENCTALKSVNLPAGLKVMKGAVFAACSSLEGEIVIPDNITEIEARLFEGCSSLTNVVLPGNLEKIGISAFGGCSGLNSINLPTKLKEIGGSAFYGANITEVTLPASVTAIGSQAFYHDASAVKIHFQSTTPPKIGFEFISSSFSDQNTIYVPQASLQKYTAIEIFDEEYGMDLKYEMFGTIVAE